MAANDDAGFDSLASRTTFPASSGLTYFIAVDGYADRDRIGDRGGHHPQITPFAGTVPANDAFASRTTIPRPDFGTSGTSLGATHEPGELDKAYNPGGASLWWSFTPTEPELLEVSTEGSSIDTILAVFTGTDLANLAEVASNDEAGTTRDSSSALTFVARPGTEHLIAMDGFNGQSGDYRLNLRRRGLVTPVLLADFNAASGFSPGQPLGGQQDWLAAGDGRHEVITGAFPGDGQAALIGADPSAATTAASQVFTWTPLDVNPPAGRLVRFSTRMAVNDSSNRVYDNFSWQIFNHQAEALFGLAFDNANLLISSISDDGGFQSTGFTFPNDTPFRLTIEMDFRINRWSAFVNDLPIVQVAPISVTGRQLTLNEINAAWTINAFGTAGDNHMVFDNYSVDLVESTVFEGRPLDLSVAAGGPGTLTYQWLRNAAPVFRATQPVLTIPAVQITDAGTYTVAVSNQYGGKISGPIVVIVQPAPAPPANDQFADAARIISLPHLCQTSNDGATGEAGEPLHGGRPGGASVW